MENTPLPTTQSISSDLQRLKSSIRGADELLGEVIWWFFGCRAATCEHNDTDLRSFPDNLHLVHLRKTISSLNNLIPLMEERNDHWNRLAVAMDKIYALVAQATGTIPEETRNEIIRLIIENRAANPNFRNSKPIWGR